MISPPCSVVSLFGTKVVVCAIKSVRGKTLKNLRKLWKTRQQQTNCLQEMMNSSCWTSPSFVFCYFHSFGKLLNIYIYNMHCIRCHVMFSQSIKHFLDEDRHLLSLKQFRKQELKTQKKHLLQRSDKVKRIIYPSTPPKKSHHKRHIVQDANK